MRNQRLRHGIIINCQREFILDECILYTNRQQGVKHMSKSEELFGSTSNFATSDTTMIEHPQAPSDSEFTFAFNVHTSQILDLFEAVTLEQKFDLIESEQTHATAIQHAKKSFMQVIDCFNWWSEGNVTAIKMNITTRQKDSKRVCRIRGLVGSRKQVADFIEKFRSKSKELVASKQVTALEEEEVQMNEQQANPFYLESCAAYMFHKILSNQKYGLGSVLHSSINNFKAEFENAEKSAQQIPLPMKKAVSLCEEIVSNLYKDFNYGRHEMEQIMPYCRISVEKYVFEKIDETLRQAYAYRNKAQNQIFELKTKAIHASLTPQKVFEDISLSSELTFCSLDHPAFKQPGGLTNTPTAKKYEKACQQFRRIKDTHSPREKVKHCQIMYTYLRTVVYEESGGKKELVNMEDILPVLILVLLLCGLPSLRDEISVMVDFVGFDPCDLEAQRRLLVNISESYNYICRDWKVPM